MKVVVADMNGCGCFPFRRPPSRWVPLVLALMICAAPLAAQREEFLSPGEIAQIREAQEPDQRLKLYVEFAGYRLESVEKELAGNQPNRGELIHAFLTEYDRIIDAIDANAENAVAKRLPARKGLEQALKAEPDYLQKLHSIRTRNPKDLTEYKFILERAIDTTESSMAFLREALGKQPKGRKEEKEEKEQRKKQPKAEKGHAG